MVCASIENEILTAVRMFEFDIRIGRVHDWDDRVGRMRWYSL